MATILAVSSPLRTRALPQISRWTEAAFICRRCLHKQANQSQHRAANKSFKQTPFLKAFRQRGAIATRHSSSATIQPSVSPLGALGQSINRAETRLAPTKASVWPETSSKSVAYWLIGSAASVFGIVVFGGLTRLTESGLSITEWRPVTGSRPPMNADDWAMEFSRYRSSPEFKLLNPRMTIDEFKHIYWMEWTHRLWGRVVGITFLIPTLYFVAMRRVSGRMALKLTGICGLIGFQGVLGWWMVKSGLKDDLFAPGSHPRVSQYRLAAHLGTAFLCYTAILWNGLSILREHRLLANPSESAKYLENLSRPELRFLRRSVAALAALVFLTTMSGALVAGLDAGLIYNDFPWMGGSLTPPKSELFDPFYSHTPDRSDLWWRNGLENPVLVQLDHRIMATTTFTAIMALWAYTHFKPQVRALLPKAGKAGVLGLVYLVTLQVVLGITTLWYLVPTPLAAAHQAGALALLTGAVVLGGRVWVPRRASSLIRQRLARTQSDVGRRGPDAMLAARLGR